MEGRERGGGGRRGIARSSPAFNSINKMLHQNRGTAHSGPSTNHPNKETNQAPPQDSERIPVISETSGAGKSCAEPAKPLSNPSVDSPSKRQEHEKWSDEGESEASSSIDGAKWGHSGWSHSTHKHNTSQSQPKHSRKDTRRKELKSHPSHPEKEHRPGLDENSLRKYFLSENSTRFSAKRIEESVVEYSEGIGDDADLWDELVDGWIVEAALVKGYSFMDLAVDLMLQLIGKESFHEAAHDSVMRRIGEVMRGSGGEGEEKQLPRLMGRLLVAPWPRGFNSCAKEANPVLFSVLSIVQGWLEILKQLATFQPEKHEADIVQICCDCLAHLTFAAGRKLWLQWPETIDGIYSVLRSLIVNPNDIDATTKSRLLDLYVKLKDWTKPSEGRKPAVHVYVQTDSRLRK